MQFLQKRTKRQHPILTMKRYSILSIRGICYWDAALGWSRIIYDYYNHMLACIECGKLKSFLAWLCSLERLYLQVQTKEKFLWTGTNWNYAYLCVCICHLTPFIIYMVYSLSISSGLHVKLSCRWYDIIIVLKKGKH